MNIQNFILLKEKIENAVISHITKMNNGFFDKKNSNKNIIEPPTDIYSDKDRKILFLETPGIDENSIEILLKNKKITISCEKLFVENINRQYLHIENDGRIYKKTVDLNLTKEDIKEIKTTYKYGVLKIEILQRG